MTVNCLYEYECYSLTEFNAFAGSKVKEGKIIKAIGVLRKASGSGYIVIYEEPTDFPDFNTGTTGTGNNFF